METIYLNIINKTLKIIFRDEFVKIYSSELTFSKTIDSFSESFKNFNFFLKFIIINYLFVVLIVNLIFTFIFFYKLSFNNFNISTKFLKKIPLVKNIQNFLIANFLLHTD